MGLLSSAGVVPVQLMGIWFKVQGVHSQWTISQPRRQHQDGRWELFPHTCCLLSNAGVTPFRFEIFDQDQSTI
jgi:hypothetical protein